MNKIHLTEYVLQSELYRSIIAMYAISSNPQMPIFNTTLEFYSSLLPGAPGINSSQCGSPMQCYFTEVMIKQIIAALFCVKALLHNGTSG